MESHLDALSILQNLEDDIEVLKPTSIRSQLQHLGVPSISCEGQYFCNQKGSALYSIKPFIFVGIWKGVQIYRLNICHKFRKGVINKNIHKLDQNCKTPYPGIPWCNFKFRLKKFSYKFKCVPGHEIMSF